MSFLDNIPLLDSVKSFVTNCYDHLYPVAEKWGGRAISVVKDTALSYPNATLVVANIGVCKLALMVGEIGKKLILRLSCGTLFPRTAEWVSKVTVITLGNSLLYLLLEPNPILTMAISITLAATLIIHANLYYERELQGWIREAENAFFQCTLQQRNDIDIMLKSPAFLRDFFSNGQSFGTLSYGQFASFARCYRSVTGRDSFT